MSILDEGNSKFKPLYDETLPIEEKLNIIAKEIYGADGVVIDPAAKAQIERINEMGGGKLPVCVAKTQYSLSDDPKLLGRPEGFKIKVREVRLSNGAGFVVVLTGNVLTMPGLPKHPAAENIDVTEEGKITGLF